jgi:predicted ATPase/DNA-binding CsgD family transcriptional regulator
VDRERPRRGDAVVSVARGLALCRVATYAPAILASPQVNSPATNLPVELTSFVGRRDAVADLSRTLPNARLLTLTGPGGVGKTKLALRVARETARQYPGGTWFIELAPVQDPALVTQAAFAALGLQDRAANLSMSRLTDYLAEKRCLLILDNCEHVLASAAHLATAILAVAPSVRILATSRQALGVMGEIVVDVPTLSLPEASRPPLGEALLSDAVALFVERAHAVDRDFALDAGNAATVASVCTRLDGMALAIELAAVRLQGLGLETLDESLGHRLGVLGNGDPTRPQRQQTLDAAIDWSYQLLDDAERLLWRRLSVFAGGFEAAAAADVCSDGSLPAEAVRDLVGRLVERSILKRRDGPRGGRFRILEPLRQFGHQRLEESGELESILRRHREWIGALAAIAGAGDSRQVEAFERIRSERANVWSALDFCRRSAGEAEAGAGIVRDLWVYWLSQGPATDVDRLIADLLELVPPGGRARGALLWVGSIFQSELGDVKEATRMAAEGLGIGRAIGDPEIVFWSMQMQAVAAYLDGRSDEVLEIGVESLAVATAMGWPHGQLSAALCQVMGYSVKGGDRLISVARGAVALSETLGETWQRASLHQFLATALLQRADISEALAAARESLRLRRELGDLLGMAMALETLALIESRTAEHRRAATILGIAEALWESIPAPMIEPLRATHDGVELEARNELGSAAFDAVFVAGKVLPRGDGVAYALDIAPAVTTAPAKVARGASTTDPLSRREKEVATLVAGGSTNAQVAGSLFISERTVESHLASIFNKLGVDNRMQLARWIIAAEAAPAT